MSATAASDARVRRSLSEADIPAACALSAQAGWNQTADDWRQMIQTGMAFGTVGRGGLIATAVVLPSRWC